MEDDITVLLFDVDGVLVDPLAYRAGIIQSMEILCSDIGIANPQVYLPNNLEIAYMEARGIHDVWDICNIMFSLILNKVFESFRERNMLFEFIGKETAGQLQEIRKADPSMVERPDYKNFADRIIDSSACSHPPDVAFGLLLEKMGTASKSNESWKELLKSFLQGTRSVYESYGTRIFQNIILGSCEFEATYELDSIYAGPSLLRSKDIVLINKSSVSMLRQVQECPDVKMAIYTARPSYPPPDIGHIRGYSPEAEMAIEAAGLESFPLVGMGMMQWLASKHGERTEDLTKPNTTHSLSALLAAMEQNNMSATLDLAHLLDKKDEPIKMSDLTQLSGRQIHVFVFEDTSSGITPMLLLAEKLNANGFSISVTAFGIAQDENKKKVLAALCQKVFPDVNQALEYWWQSDYS